MPTEEIIVLASSRKLGGRCVAGISMNSGEWVRPISNLAHGQLLPYHCRVDGRLPELLDVVRFGYEESLDDPAQPENLLIDEKEWELTSVLDPSDAYPALREHIAAGPELLGNRGKAVPEEKAEAGVDASLALVEPATPVEFILRSPDETHGKLKPHVIFTLGPAEYELGLTDFSVGPLVRQRGLGTYTEEDLGMSEGEKTLLTISLAEAHNQWHTKLAAAVLFLPA